LTKERFFEWSGTITAIAYCLLVASNTGAEFIGFLLLLVSSALIGVWAFMGKHRGILFLQLFYATAGFIGMFRWY
jgi:nicotinamide riboside transporter PnuC